MRRQIPGKANSGDSTIHMQHWPERTYGEHQGPNGKRYRPGRTPDAFSDGKHSQYQKDDPEISALFGEVTGEPRGDTRDEPTAKPGIRSGNDKVQQVCGKYERRIDHGSTHLQIGQQVPEQRCCKYQYTSDNQRQFPGKRPYLIDTRLSIPDRKEYNASEHRKCEVKRKLGRGIEHEGSEQNRANHESHWPDGIIHATHEKHHKQWNRKGQNKKEMAGHLRHFESTEAKYKSANSGGQCGYVEIIE